MAVYRWRKGLKHVHSTAYIGRNCGVHRDLVMAPYSFININCSVWPRVTIGAYSMLAPRVTIAGGDHSFQTPGVPIIFAEREEIPETKIGKDVWLGFGVIVIAGCSIGDGAIVAAGSVVTKDIPPFEIHAGVPAKKLRDRFKDPAMEKIHMEKLSQTPSRGSYCPPL